MKLKLFQVDTFTDRVCRGNPAAVVPLECWIDEALMQSIANENNLSETAFFVPDGDKYHLRWFTPRHEVPLCGHATLAAAFIIFTVLDPSKTTVRFDTLSGPLNVTRNNDSYFTLDLPKQAPSPCDVPAGLIDGLNMMPLEVLVTETDTNYFAVFENEHQIRSIQPNHSILEQLHPYGVAVTAKSDDVDFISRYFAPGYGIPEDYVTGSIHCALVPFWSNRLGKSKLHAFQASDRGGRLICEESNDRILISGRAVKYLSGEIFIDSD